VSASTLRARFPPTGLPVSCEGSLFRSRQSAGGLSRGEFAGFVGMVGETAQGIWFLGE
jgi:hypothetical protein